VKEKGRNGKEEGKFKLNDIIDAKGTKIKTKRVPEVLALLEAVTSESRHLY
jgi:hypothetical protein